MMWEKNPSRIDAVCVAAIPYTPIPSHVHGSNFYSLYHVTTPTFSSIYHYPHDVWPVSGAGKGSPGLKIERETSFNCMCVLTNLGRRVGSIREDLFVGTFGNSNYSSLSREKQAFTRQNFPPGRE
ncbi:hypothetical protein CDAR_422221 [Caerostris darwini]|uniref:Uncharacterized protein n=1 Tax=Caerostris darwini TaxID=1538125 RepID=A0AAV4WS02_9ARAC|nr:hypothetical protein CDAR_422221 [Caerostris darwini]